MNERILTNKNHGMRALVLWILAFVASIFLCVIGSSLVDTFGGSVPALFEPGLGRRVYRHAEGIDVIEALPLKGAHEGPWGYSFWCWGSCGSASAGFFYAA